jgi:hypothetical protein
VLKQWKRSRGDVDFLHDSACNRAIIALADIGPGHDRAGDVAAGALGSIGLGHGLLLGRHVVVFGGVS